MSSPGSNDRLALIGGFILAALAIVAVVVGVAWHEYQQNDSYKTCLKTRDVTALECKAARP